MGSNQGGGAGRGDFDMASPQVGMEVGSRLAVVEEVKRRRRQDDQNFFMRIHVALPIYMGKAY